MKGTRFLDGHRQVDEHRGCLALSGGVIVGEGSAQPAVTSSAVSSELSSSKVLQ